MLSISDDRPIRHALKRFFVAASVVAFLTAVPGAYAQIVLYDEAVDGDAGDESNPENLGTLGLS